MKIETLLTTLHYNGKKPQNVSEGRWNAMKNWVNKRLSEGFEMDKLASLNKPNKE